MLVLIAWLPRNVLERWNAPPPSTRKSEDSWWLRCVISMHNGVTGSNEDVVGMFQDGLEVRDDDKEVDR
jgi:hypothetical protein